MPALILALCLLGSWAVQAAQSPVGVWRIDQASLENSLDQLITGLVERLPEDQQTLARQSMEQQRTTIKQQIAGAMAARIEFFKDGSVVFDQTSTKQSERGSWRQDGDTLHIDDTDPDSPDLTGSVSADRIELHFDVDQSNPDQAPLANLVWVLVPAR